MTGELEALWSMRGARDQTRCLQRGDGPLEIRGVDASCVDHRAEHLERDMSRVAGLC
jgi:hypothetical protein